MEVKLAYLAGLIDGEGCVGVYSRMQKGRREYVGVLTIANTREPLLQWVVERFGGYYKVKQKVRGHKAVYSWTMTDRQKANELLRNVMPYLVIKKEQAQAFIDLPLWVSTRWMSCDAKRSFRELRESLAYKCSVLNKRGDLDESRI